MIFYKKLSAIQAMTFDLDDTLYDNGSIIKNADDALSAFMYQEYPLTQSLQKFDWRQIQKELLTNRPSLQNDMGQLRLQTLEVGFKRLSYTQQQASEAARRCFEYFYFHRSDFVVDSNIRAVLAKLANKIPLVAITNGNVNIQQIGIADYFSASFKASLNMPMKPHRAMFDAVQQQLGIAAKNILHVGDNLEKDVYGATRAGYQTAWYADDRQMKPSAEDILTLPHVQLQSLNQLLELVF
ncbi:HAD-IA family hydrolase [Paraglaciecola aquimarina]|uniref:HAD-IA family hydrolase n=1 Tax=Paraglaciecola aquimarina TaxID=1235557 RepID=A0ABU3ST06_9ALTE|nr:HAD-IA family hydrolase [Paraglaciecola aquimarina]MDU0353147.1 HAD-IA family hydrolase [Paraglaciecola aquimarina]